MTAESSLPRRNPRPAPGGSVSRSVHSALPLPCHIAWRFLRGRRNRLVDGTAAAALAATTLGVAAMVVAMALMTGYREDLQAKLIRGNAAVVIYPLGPWNPAGAAPALAALRAIAGVERVDLVAYAQGSLASADGAAESEVTLRGVGRAEGFAGAEAALLGPGADGIQTVVLGSELARRLEAGEGQVLRLVALGFEAGRPQFRYRTVRVAGTFRTGFSVFDERWALADRALVERLAGKAGASTLIELAVDNPRHAARIAEQAHRALGEDYLVSHWQELNRDLFTALELQQVALFFVLGLIVLVSTFNVASTLVVLVRERMREVGALGALGLPAAGVRAVFLVYGGTLAAAGTLGGVLLGSAVAWVFTTFELIRFDPEVAAIYFISSVPFRVRAGDVAAVAAFTLLVTFAACWMPARRAARVNPSEALRYE